MAAVIGEREGRDEDRDPAARGRGSDDPGPVRLCPAGRRIAARAVGWWAARSLTVVLAGAVVLATGDRFTGAPRGLLLLGGVLLALAGVLLVVVGPLRRYRVHRWQATDTAVWARTGWLVVEWRVAPLSRVQTVDTVRGPWEQLFGLATLRVTTASAAGPVRIPGLDRATATAAAEALTDVTERTPGDAT